MTYDDIYCVTERLQTATPDEIAAAEAALGARFPPGYAEFVSRFGEGVLSNWVRVIAPKRLAEERAEHRQRLEEYYFWDQGADVLARQQVLDSILVADTLNGDEVVYHAQSPAGLYALPRYEETIYAVGQTLPEAIAWLCTSGTLTAPLSFLSFEPEADRAQQRFEAEASGPSFETTRDALVGLQLHDHAVDATEDEDKCFDLFFREFGGSVTIVEGENGAIVGLRSDEGASGLKLDRVLATMRALGLQNAPL